MITTQKRFVWQRSRCNTIKKAHESWRGWGEASRSPRLQFDDAAKMGAVAIVLGDDICCIDLDKHVDGIDGVQVFKSLFAIPSTTYVESTKTGGCHILYRKTCDLGKKKIACCPGVDILHGNNLLVIAPTQFVIPTQNLKPKEKKCVKSTQIINGIEHSVLQYEAVCGSLDNLADFPYEIMSTLQYFGSVFKKMCIASGKKTLDEHYIRCGERHNRCNDVGHFISIIQKDVAVGKVSLAMAKHVCSAFTKLLVEDADTWDMEAEWSARLQYNAAQVEKGFVSVPGAVPTPSTQKVARASKAELITVFVEEILNHPDVRVQHDLGYVSLGEYTWSRVDNDTSFYSSRQFVMQKRILDFSQKDLNELTQQLITLCKSMVTDDRSISYAEWIAQSPSVVRLRDGVATLEGIVKNDVTVREHRYVSPVVLPMASSDIRECDENSEGYKWLMGVACNDPKTLTRMLSCAAHCLFPYEFAPQAYFLYGSGANGKSCFTNWILEKLCKGTTSHVGFDGFADNSHAFELLGKALNVSNEYQGERLSSKHLTMIKTLTGAGDSIQLRQLYQRPVTITPRTNLIFCCNSLPREMEQSQASARRIAVIRFQASFLDSRDFSEHEKNEIFLDLFPFICRQALDEMKNGTVKQSTIQATGGNQYFHDFISACCTTEDGSKVKSHAMFSLYRIWWQAYCMEQGMSRRDTQNMALSHKAFTQRLVQATNCGLVRTNEARLYAGVGVSETLAEIGITEEVCDLLFRGEDFDCMDDMMQNGTVRLLVSKLRERITYDMI